MKHEDPDPIQPGELKTGCLLWLCILVGFLFIAAAILAAMALLAPGGGV